MTYNRSLQSLNYGWAKINKVPLQLFLTMFLKRAFPWKPYYDIWARNRLVFLTHFDRDVVYFLNLSSYLKEENWESEEPITDVDASAILSFVWSGRDISSVTSPDPNIGTRRLQHKMPSTYKARISQNTSLIKISIGPVINIRWERNGNHIWQIMNQTLIIASNRHQSSRRVRPSNQGAVRILQRYTSKFLTSFGESDHQ